MTPELNQDNADRRSNPSYLRRLGETVVGIGVAYVALKLGEEVFNFALSYPVEMGISTAVGSTPVAIKYANLEHRNNSTE